MNFISTQSTSLIASAGYHQSYVRTGYEYVIGNRTSDAFCFNAKQDGKVLEISARGLIVEYADGTQEGCELGRRYGKAEGTVYPHDIACHVKVAQKFKKGDTLAYNTGFFEPDALEPQRVVYKNSMNVKVALYESAQTHEDSSAISADISEKLSSTTVKIKSYVLNFTQNVRQVKTPGDAVAPEDVLMIIEDEITASTAFDEKSLQALQKLSNQAPRAGYKGRIDKIEVLYHGDKADMSATIKTLADRSDKEMAAALKAKGEEPHTGAVTDDYRVSGTPLALDKVEIRFYISMTTDMGNGDKLVFANQCKSTVSEVMNYTMTTEKGEKINAVFSALKIYARILNSPFIIGTTTTLLKLVAKNAVSIYRGQGK